MCPKEPNWKVSGMDYGWWSIRHTRHSQILAVPLKIWRRWMIWEPRIWIQLWMWATTKWQPMTCFVWSANKSSDGYKCSNYSTGVPHTKDVHQLSVKNLSIDQHIDGVKMEVEFTSSSEQSTSAPKHSWRLTGPRQRRLPCVHVRVCVQPTDQRQKFSATRT